MFASCAILSSVVVAEPFRLDENEQLAAVLQTHRNEVRNHAAKVLAQLRRVPTRDLVRGSLDERGEGVQVSNLSVTLVRKGKPLTKEITIQ